MTSPAGGADDTTPIHDFSNCHAGILAQLQRFERLPGLLEAAAEARRIAADVLRFFHDVVLEHHTEEERDLFPAVISSAQAGAERERVQGLVKRLTQEHREVEAAFRRLEPALKAAAKGQDVGLGADAVAALVAEYQGHARFEESEFLPLSAAILSRNPDHMAALGVALHIRHATPEVMKRFGSRI